jgi:superkiller protein 3
LKNINYLIVMVLAVVIAGGGCRSGNKTDGVLEYGLALMQEGDYEGASEALIEAASVYSNSVTVHYNLGFVYWKLGRIGDAIASLTRASDLSDNDSRPAELLAYVLLDSGNALGANKILSEIETPAPSALTLMALASQKAGSSDLARSYLGKALDIDADYPPALYNLALLYRDVDKNPREALIYYKHFKTVAPNDMHADESLQAFIRRELLPEEVEIKPSASGSDASIEPPQIEPVADVPVVPPANEVSSAEDVSKRLAKADAELKQDNADTALILLKDTVSRYPDSADAVWALAGIYDNNLGNKKKAAELYKKFAVMFPNDSRAAGIVKPQPKPIIPQATVRSPVELSVETGETYFREGLKCYGDKNWDASISAYRKALKLNPKSARTAYNLGLAYKAKGDLSNAAKAFMVVLHIQPDKINALYMLGLTEKERGRNNAALMRLNRLLRIQPDFANAHFLLAIINLEENRPDMTAIHYEQFVHLCPTGSNAEMAKAWLVKYKGRRD